MTPNGYRFGSNSTVEYGECYGVHNTPTQATSGFVYNTELEDAASVSLVDAAVVNAELHGTHSQSYDFNGDNGFEGTQAFSLSDVNLNLEESLSSNIQEQELNDSEDLYGLDDWLAPTGLPEMESSVGNSMAQDSTPPTGSNVLPDDFDIVPDTIDILMDGNRFVCTHLRCNKTFSRIGDLRRHKNTQHRPPQYNCSMSTCNRKGANAFRRGDKLREHQRKVHGMAV